MPELPEVEVIKRGLDSKIIGLSIQQIDILNPKTFQGDSKAVLGSKIIKIWRRAKVLGMDLDNGFSLLVHLKMSGQLVLVAKDRFIGGHPTLDMTGVMPNKSTRVIFEFSNEAKLFFNDQRKFGWIKVIKILEVKNQKFLQSLGPEPLERGFGWEALKANLLRHKSQPIKVAIMDQEVVAGVGNIYASEACFLAKINPKTKVSALTDANFQSLAKGIIESLNKSIDYGGSSKAHFVNEVGEKGYYLVFANVYGRAGQPCLKCHTPISKIALAGRGTYFCPHCQNV